jgi:hypothetical protein
MHGLDHTTDNIIFFSLFHLVGWGHTGEYKVFGPSVRRLVVSDMKFRSEFMVSIRAGMNPLFVLLECIFFSVIVRYSIVSVLFQMLDLDMIVISCLEFLQNYYEILDFNLYQHARSCFPSLLFHQNN